MYYAMGYTGMLGSYLLFTTLTYYLGLGWSYYFSFEK